jgi:hypothetical protein
MADVAGFDAILFDPIEGDYQEGGKAFVELPPEGKYMGQAPVFTDESFTNTREGYLKVIVDPITVQNPGGPGDGYKIRFSSLSAKKYSNRNASQVMDFLRACGLNVKPNSTEEVKQYIKACSGRTFQFALAWEGYDKNDPDRQIRGQEAFGGQRYVTSNVDETVKIWANGKVKFYISAVGK